MAYVPGNLAQITSVNGQGLYRYDSLDDSATVSAAGYFNNSDDTLLLRLGDLIWVFEWATAVHSGTIVDLALHVVGSVDVGGSVTLSNDALEATL